MRADEATAGDVGWPSTSGSPRDSCTSEAATALAAATAVSRSARVTVTSTLPVPVSRTAEVARVRSSGRAPTATPAACMTAAEVASTTYFCPTSCTVSAAAVESGRGLNDTMAVAA